MRAKDSAPTASGIDAHRRDRTPFIGVRSESRRSRSADRESARLTTREGTRFGRRKQGSHDGLKVRARTYADACAGVPKFGDEEVFRREVRGFCVRFSEGHSAPVTNYGWRVRSSVDRRARSTGPQRRTVAGLAFASVVLHGARRYWCG